MSACFLWAAPVFYLTFDCLGTALPYWLVGRIASMFVVGVGLVLIGIPVAFTLAVITGLFSFVSLLGPIGLMFATPLVLTMTLVVQVVYLKHGLGEEIQTPRATR